MYLQRNTEERLRAHCYRGKAASMIYSECVAVALVLQHAKCIRRIILSPVACPAVPYFLINGAVLGKKIYIDYKMSDTITKVHMSSCKVPAILVRF